MPLLRRKIGGIWMFMGSGHETWNRAKSSLKHLKKSGIPTGLQGIGGVTSLLVQKGHIILMGSQKARPRKMIDL